MNETPNSVRVDHKQIEQEILDYLATVNYNDRHSIWQRLYTGGFPVLLEKDVQNALYRLERAGKVKIERMWISGRFKQKLWAVTERKTFPKSKLFK